MKKYLYLIILIHILIHLPFLFLPPSHGHRFRECHTAAVARNFYDESANIFLPRVDERGDTDGVTGMEFPLYQYLVSLTYKLFGAKDFLGRFVSLLFSIITIIFFYKWTKENSTEQVALFSTLCFVATCSFFVYSIKIMPQVFALCLHVCSLYLLSNYYFKQKGQMFFLLGVFMLILAVLTRPYHFVLLLFLLFYNKKLTKKFSFYILTFLSLLPAFIWYVLWVPWLVNKNKLYSFFMGIGINEAFKQLFELGIKNFLFLKIFAQEVINWGEAALLLLGIFNIKKLKNQNALNACSLTILFLVVFLLLKVGMKHILVHAYYLLGILPYISFILGMIIHKLNIKNIFVLPIIIIPLFTTKIHLYYKKDVFVVEMKKLQEKTSKIIPTGSLIAVNGSPEMLYFLYLKGWLLNENDMVDTIRVRNLKNRGLKFLVFYKPYHSDEFIKNTFRNYKIYTFPKEKIYIIDLTQFYNWKQ